MLLLVYTWLIIVHLQVCFPMDKTGTCNLYNLLDGSTVEMQWNKFPLNNPKSQVQWE